MKVILNKYKIKKLYELTHKEKYYFIESTPELVKLTNVEYQEKLENLDYKMKECNNGLFKSAEYFLYEDQKNRLLVDDCWELQSRLNNFEPEHIKEMNEEYMIEIDDEDCCYIDKLEKKN